MNDLFRGTGIEVNIKDPSNFLKICETLTRIGIKSGNKLFQTCHLLHKRDSEGTPKYAVLMFKELFKLDGKDTNIDEVDIERRNRIALLLEQWGLVEIIQEVVTDDEISAPFMVISFKDKTKYELIQKYTVGKGKKNGR